MKYDISNISILDLHKLLVSGYQFNCLDCRPLLEYSKHHLMNAVHIDNNKEAVPMYINNSYDLFRNPDAKVFVILTNTIKLISKEFLNFLSTFKFPIKICTQYEKFYQKYSKDHQFYINDMKREQMSEVITRFLYIGNQQDSEDLELLEKKGITHIINASSHIRNSFPHKFKYLRIPILDGSGQNISNFFEETYAFIESARKTNGRVLVHCYAGISRSSTIVIAYIMRKHLSTFLSTFMLVKNKRPIVNPNSDFRKHLYNYEKYLMNIKKTPK